MLRSFFSLIRNLGAMLSGRPSPQRWKEDRMRDDLDDFRIPWRLEGEPCEVYLFQRWGGYSHPVLPGGPLTLEASLHSSSLCRAYVREFGGEPLMVCFACYAAHNRELDTGTELAPGCYAVEEAGDGSPHLGVPLDRIAAAMSGRLFVVEQRQPGGPPTAVLRELKWAYSFEYEYDANGVLQATFGVSEDGRREIP
ncbi:hypothetical protein OV090_45500 [Nannocystis sp. RBIL2]|uniref:hypothetical protein n=1 Tax=Nannocystis sp. RBIL2 TaxID=2996788 RepID=UPI00226EBFB9|nr:hypothetical protein [Nannocystis sp. RBIL2]MCY1072087.1 hypothetical protein [Nannocystis sp. RBIL2]